MSNVNGNGHPVNGGTKPKPTLEDSPLPDEYTSLIPKPGPQDESWDASGGDKEAPEAPRGKRLLYEFWKLFKGAVPVILAYMLQMSLQTVTVIIVGHSSPLNLAASAFSLMFALVTGWMIALGGTTALDTLASSTFTGSGNKYDLGILLQRSFLVLGAFYIPVAVIWACSEHIFLALGQDPELSYHSSRFLMCLIPGGLGYIYFEIMKKYLQAQGESQPEYDLPLVNIVPNLCVARYHESRYIRLDHNLAPQRRINLSLLLQTRNGTPRRSFGSRYLILAIFHPLGSLRKVRRRLRLLGRMVASSIPESMDLFPPGTSWYPACRHRMVGL